MAVPHPGDTPPISGKPYTTPQDAARGTGAGSVATGAAMTRMTGRRWRAAGTWCKRAACARGLRLAVQRARRGWHEEDVWGLDRYLARVASETLAYLADTTHGYPCDSVYGSQEEWCAYLRDLAGRLRAWVDDPLDADGPSFAVTREAIEELAREFGNFWD